MVRNFQQNGHVHANCRLTGGMLAAERSLHARNDVSQPTLVTRRTPHHFAPNAEIVQAPTAHFQHCEPGLNPTCALKNVITHAVRFHPSSDTAGPPQQCMANAMFAPFRRHHADPTKAFGSGHCTRPDAAITRVSTPIFPRKQLRSALVNAIHPHFWHRVGPNHRTRFITHITTSLDTQSHDAHMHGTCKRSTNGVNDTMRANIASLNPTISSFRRHPSQRSAPSVRKGSLSKGESSRRFLPPRRATFRRCRHVYATYKTTSSPFSS